MVWIKIIWLLFSENVLFMYCALPFFSQQTQTIKYNNMEPKCLHIQIPKQEVQSSNRICILNKRLTFILDYHQKDIIHSKTKLLQRIHTSLRLYAWKAHICSFVQFICTDSTEEPPPGYDSCFQLAPINLKTFYFHLSFYFQTSWLEPLALVLFCLLPKTTNQYHQHSYYILIYHRPSQRPRPLAC